MMKTTVYLTIIGHHEAKKAGGNMTMNAQHIIIYFCIIYVSS